MSAATSEVVRRGGKVLQVVPMYDPTTGTLSPFLTERVDYYFQDISTVRDELLEFCYPYQTITLNSGQECEGRILDPRCDLVELAVGISEYIAATKTGVKSVQIWSSGDISRVVHILITGTDREIMLLHMHPDNPITMEHTFQPTYFLTEPPTTLIATYSPPREPLDNVARRLRAREAGLGFIPELRWRWHER